MHDGEICKLTFALRPRRVFAGSPEDIDSNKATLFFVSLLFLCTCTRFHLRFRSPVPFSPQEMYLGSNMGKEEIETERRGFFWRIKGESWQFAAPVTFSLQFYPPSSSTLLMHFSFFFAPEGFFRRKKPRKMELAIW